MIYFIQDILFKRPYIFSLLLRLCRVFVFLSKINLVIKLSLNKTLFKTVKVYEMFNLDDITKKDDNKDWPYRKLIIGPSGSEKSNYLLNSIQKDNNIINKIYLFAKDLEEPKYHFLIEYSNSMDDIFVNIEDYNKKRKRKF